jgi:hypothetical protein
MKEIKKKKRIVWFHYNKPYSKKFGVDKWTVHWNGACLIVDKIICLIPSFSHNRKNQPRVVMRGYASSVIDDNGTITIK